MTTTAQSIAYKDTGFFSKIILDYISGNKLLQSFYKHMVSVEGIKNAIEERKKYPTNRKVLVEVLQKQYADFSITPQQQHNITQLNNPHCFTITTAHQPNIFTGYLYFIYKILHTIKLSNYLKTQWPQYNFVPIYYMGSEDADLEELGHVFINGEKKIWQTTQTGAVGRMRVDKALLQLIDSLAGQITVQPFGKFIIDLIKICYKENSTIEQATFKLVNELFAGYGLLIVLPDNAALKKMFIPVIEKELNETFSHREVAKTVAAFPKEYKVQASGRELNLFYLTENSRERIITADLKYKIKNSNLEFSAQEITEELHQHPERFSPNVILRPVFQETILPNIAFIGGGGEIAYWLELQNVFKAVNVPYPVLILRNSFLLIEKKMQQLSQKLALKNIDLFKSHKDLLQQIVFKNSTLVLNIENEKQQLNTLYNQIKNIAANVDSTLGWHTMALQKQALNKLTQLQKKIIKAETKKFEAQQRQLQQLKSALFPNNNLQERVENFIPYYAMWGNDFIKNIYENSLTLQQELVILSEK